MATTKTNKNTVEMVTIILPPDPQNKSEKTRFIQYIDVDDPRNTIRGYIPVGKPVNIPKKAYEKAIKDSYLYKGHVVAEFEKDPVF